MTTRRCTYSIDDEGPRGERQRHAPIRLAAIERNDDLPDADLYEKVSSVYHGPTGDILRSAELKMARRGLARMWPSAGGVRLRVAGDEVGKRTGELAVRDRA